MRVHFLARLAVGLTIFAAATLAQDQAADMSAQGAVIHRAVAGQRLTGPSQSAPGQIVADFLRANGRSNQTASSLVTTLENPTSSGITHVRLEQQVDGLTVYGAYVKAALNSQGELLQVIEVLAPVGPVGRASINEADALNAVVGQLYPSARPGLRRGAQSGNTVSFSQNGFFHRDPTVTRVIVPFASGRLQEGFLVETWTQDSNLLHHTLVGGNGQVVSSELRTNQDSYNVFPDHPLNSSQTITAGPGNGNSESPSGWLYASGQKTVNISGNNVHAYLDSDANNSPDAGGTAVTTGDFLTALNTSQQPTTTQNKAVAVQSLFYLNNKIHDELYKHGFTEVWGNFQESNFGRGGAASDSVNAEAQDGSGTNNANFSTPSDGSNPRMQMYIWTVVNPNRDGDVDSDIVYHEYGHGLTWRMIGNMSGPMSGAIGEGASDVLSIVMNNDDVVGEYSYNRSTGIRRYRYANYPLTYGDFTGQSVHNDGEIYAAAVWKLWELYQAQSTPISQQTLLDDLVGGMMFTPSGPAMQDMRDGILAQAQDSRDCLIWEAFAALGIGEGATSRTKGGGPFGGGSVTVSESFAVPSQCSGGPEQLAVTTSSLPDGTINQTYPTTTLQATGGTTPYVWGVTGLPTGLGYDSNTGQISGAPSETGIFSVGITVTDDLGATASKTLTLTINPDQSGDAPAAPSDLTISVKRRFVMLSWSDNSNNETEFVLTRCLDGGCTDTSLPAGTTNYKDSDIQSGASYSVKAVNNSGTSASSNTVSVP